MHRSYAPICSLDAHKSQDTDSFCANFNPNGVQGLLAHYLGTTGVECLTMLLLFLLINQLMSLIGCKQ